MAEPPGCALQVENLSVSLGGHAILRNAGLVLQDGRTMAIIGQSGCGKTTLLKAIAGLLPVDSGRITVAGRPIDSLPPRARNAVYLYQEPLLFPHLDVFENVAFGLRIRGIAGAELQQRVRPMLEQLDLAALTKRRPQALSGGQRQRVAFGRALIIEPALLLLDEPFSNLDPEARMGMQTLFKTVAGAHGIASIFVTHDVKEALLIGDAFGLLRGGQLHVYRDRAGFLADPASGVSREAEFWRQVRSTEAEAPRQPER